MTTLLRQCLMLMASLLLAGTEAYAQTVEQTGQGVPTNASSQPVVGTSQQQSASPQESSQDVSVTHSAQPVVSVQQPRAGEEPLVLPPEEQPTEEAPVDVMPVWKLLHAHDYPHARDAIAQLHQKYPAWIMSADMQRTLDQEAITYARENHQPEEVRALAAAHPDLFSCPDVYNLWALADADFALHDMAAMESIYQRIVAECDEKAILSTVDQASGRLSSERLKLLLAKADARVTSDEGKKHLAALRSRRGGPDLTSIAALLNHGQVKEAKRRVAALEPAITANRDYASARQIGWMYYKVRQPESASAWFDRALRWHPDSNALKGAILSEAARKRWDMVDRLTSQYRLTPDEKKMLGGIFVEGAVTAAKQDDAPAAIHFAERGSSYGNDSGWSAAGWEFLNAGHMPEAAALFAKAPDSASVREARVLAMQRSGDLEGAEKLACANKEDKLKACDDILSELADNAFKAGRWDEVRQWAAEAKQLGVNDRAIQTEEAWSAYRQQHYADAAAMFSDLYNAHPDKDAADGLMSALKADHNLDQAKQMANDEGGPLGESYYTAAADTYYGRKQFVAAEDAKPGAYPQLANIGSPKVGAGVEFRDRNGDAGEARVEAVTGYVDGSQSFGRNTLDARLENGYWQIGKPRPGDPIGSATLPWTRSPTSSADLTTPTVRFTHQDDIAYAVDFGSSPLGGEVDGRPVGDASVTFNQPGHSITGAAFSEPRLDSLLSAAGMVDPVTGRHWGRVTESGVEAQGYVDLGHNWSLAGTVLGSHLDGDDVASNNRVSAGGALNYTMHPQWFDYLRFGPGYFWESYSRNLSYFTLGQGGYYSPESLNLPYVSAEFLTSEGQRFQLWGLVSAGWNIQRLQSSPFFPLTGAGPFYAASSSSGPSGYAALRAAYLLSPHWIANAFAWTSAAQEYREMMIGAGISYSFDGRSAAMSSDLPDHIGQPRY